MEIGPGRPQIQQTVRPQRRTCRENVKAQQSRSGRPEDLQRFRRAKEQDMQSKFAPVTRRSETERSPNVFGGSPQLFQGGRLQQATSPCGGTRLPTTGLD